MPYTFCEQGKIGQVVSEQAGIREEYCPNSDASGHNGQRHQDGHNDRLISDQRREHSAQFRLGGERGELGRLVTDWV